MNIQKIKVLHVKRYLAAIFITIFIIGCDCSDTNTQNTEDKNTKDPVSIMMVGSIIEGISICSQTLCQRSNSEGVVYFKEQGTFRFMLNGMLLSERNITANTTIVTPYTLFEEAKTALVYELFIHTLDTSDDVNDSYVQLSFSPFVPSAESFNSFLETNLSEGLLKFNVNEHNISIDTTQYQIIRDDINWTHTPTEKSAYSALTSFASFIESADSKKVRLFNSKEYLTLSRLSPASFILEESYLFEAKLEHDKLFISIRDLISGTVSEADFIAYSDERILETSLITLEITQK